MVCCQIGKSAFLAGFRRFAFLAEELLALAHAAEFITGLGASARQRDHARERIQGVASGQPVGDVVQQPSAARHGFHYGYWSGARSPERGRLAAGKKSGQVGGFGRMTALIAASKGICSHRILSVSWGRCN